MRNAWTIATREFLDRRVVLAAALVAGLMPFAAPLLPGIASGQRGQAAQTAAVLVSLGFGIVLALALGAAAIGRDLAAGRLGFDFARPVGELSVWAGRLGAALALSLAAVAVAAAPTLIVAAIGGGFALPDDAPTWIFIASVVALLLLLVPLAHAVGISLRSRSRWLVVDFVAGVLVLLVAADAVGRLAGLLAPYSAVRLAVAGVLAAVPALWIASAVQVTRGRCDLVRGHRAQALVLWPLLGAVALGMAGYASWFDAVDVDDLVRIESTRGAAAGPWLAIGGTAAGRGEFRPTFLLDATTGRSMRIGSRLWVDGTVLFSDDGRRAVWLQRDRPDGDSSATAVVVDLDGDAPRRRETTVRFSSLLLPVDSALSPSGRLLAGVQGSSLSVHDLDDGRIVASVRLPDDVQVFPRAVVFPDEEHLRLYGLDDGIVIAELDLATRRLSLEANHDVGGSWFRIAPARDRVMLVGPSGAPLTIVDGRTGALLDRPADVDGAPIRTANFLADGRIVAVVGRPDDRPAIVVCEAVDRCDAAIPVGEPGGAAYVGGELAEDRLLVGVTPSVERGGDRDWKHARSFVIDLAGRRAEPLPEPSVIPMISTYTTPWTEPRPGSAASRLFWGQDSCDLRLLDPATLTTIHLAGGSCPEPKTKRKENGSEG